MGLGRTDERKEIKLEVLLGPVPLRPPPRGPAEARLRVGDKRGGRQRAQEGRVWFSVAAQDWGVNEDVVPALGHPWDRARGLSSLRSPWRGGRDDESECVRHSVTSDSVTPWSVARQAPLSVEFSRREYWSGWPFPSPGESSPPRDGIQVSCLAG